ncbi:unnamed protein product [Ectocarpus sp. 6 AP-2014]
MEQPSIKAIDKVSVARICSGQVITDLATAVKELVENSLDAGAKHVEVKLKEFGVDLIEVSDNGSGVSPSNYEGLALKYHTSKLATFSDLTGVRSFGFRGEALSSLCELAGSFSVTTRTADESVGVKLAYGRNGKMLGKETAPRQVGTTVSISNMFEPLPVRRGEFRRNIKKQFNKLLRGMQAYALISLGVRITVTNTKAKGGKQTHIGTQYNNKLDDNVTNVFGAKFLKTLSPVSICLPEEGRQNEEEEEEEEVEDKKQGQQGGGVTSSGAQKAKDDERKIWGMVSKAGVGVGRADNDRQFLYLNGRPVDLPKFTRAVSEVWRAYEMKQKPAFILDLRLPPGTFDVNVTPDKREIFMTGEAEVLDCLKTALHKQWESSRYTIPVNQGQLVQARLTDGAAFTLRDTTTATSPPPPEARGGASSVGVVSPGPLEDHVAAEEASVGKGEVEPVSGECSKNQGTKDRVEVVETRRESGGGATDSRESEGMKRERRTKSAEDRKRRTRDFGAPAGAMQSLNPVRSEGGDRQRSTSPSNPKRHRGVFAESDDGVGEGRASGKAAASVDGDKAGSSVQATQGGNATPAKDHGDADGGSRQRSPEGTQGPKEPPPERDSSVRVGHAPASAEGGKTPGARRQTSSGAACQPLAYDMRSILGGCRRASRLTRKRNARNASADSFSAKLSGCGAKDRDSQAAARAFSRVLHKEHFTQMRVVGQFNLGFMICLLGSDLFIMDQHACDEKYNFEVLQQTTTIHQQPLVRPLPLETSASEEMTIIDNIALFERNGFRFTIDDDQPTTKKLKITAIPFSKGTQFGVDDVHELASIVADNTNPGEMVRLPKARAMFASRACRSSFMIGKALDKGQMARVVAKMATIEQPWNCPHGRPTMRHLADVSASLRTAAGLEPLLTA